MNGLKRRIAKAEKQAGISESEDLSNLTTDELHDRRKRIVARYVANCEATDEERRAAVAALEIEDEFEMAFADLWARVISQGGLPNNETSARNHIRAAKAKADEHLRYWNKPSDSDLVRAEQPGFEPPVFSLGGEEQDTPEGFGRRREMRQRLAAICAAAEPKRS